MKRVNGVLSFCQSGIKHTSVITLLVVGLIFNLNSQADNPQPLRFYIDSDFSHHFESAESIQRGVNTALFEVEHRIQGRKVELVVTDHRGNSKRAKKNMQRYVDDPNALVYYGGLHSPPLIKYRQFIHDNGMLVLASWSAGAPITRQPSADNSVFRLSVDDSKAGEFITEYASTQKSCKTPHLLLDNGPWGDSNLRNMSKALADRGLKAHGVTRFGWNINDVSANTIIRKIVDGVPECIYLVSTPFEAAAFVNAMRKIPKAQRIPFVSHWGITGGDFHKLVNAKARKEIELSFLQTCFSFNQQPLKPFAQGVFEQAQSIYPNIETSHDIKAPVGFIHAYDITRLLLAALNKISLSDDIVANRRAIKSALETLDTPVQGLIKTYEQPFSVFSDDNLDAHEALSIDNYCMARYGDNDEILLIQ